MSNDRSCAALSKRLSSKRHHNFMEMTPGLHSLTLDNKVDRPKRGWHSEIRHDSDRPHQRHRQ
jgi:hypothetical protein